MTIEGYQKARQVLPIALFECIFRIEKPESDEELDGNSAFEFGRSIMSEKIVVTMVESIDLQVELQRLMAVPTYSQFQTSWPVQFWQFPLK